MPLHKLTGKEQQAHEAGERFFRYDRRGHLPTISTPLPHQLPTTSLPPPWHPR